MIGCHQTESQLDLLLDSGVHESTSPLVVDLRNHIATCPRCLRQYQSLVELRSLTRDSQLLITPPDDFRARLQARLALTQAESQVPSWGAVPVSPDTSPSMTSAWASATPLALKTKRNPNKKMFVAASVLSLAACALIYFSWISQQNPASVMPLMEDVVAKHAAGHPAEVHGTEPEVRNWFQGKLGFQAAPIHFSNDMKLVGARISHVREKPAAAFYYDLGGKRVTVMVFESAGSFSNSGIKVVQRSPHAQRRRPIYYTHVRGYTVPVIEKNGVAYAITADMDEDRIIHLASAATE